MKRVFTILETLIAFVFLLIGLDMVIEGVSSNSRNAGEAMIAGAVFVSLGVLVSYSAIKSILWHRAMSRHASEGDTTSRRFFG
jgi:predicted tellurium resistance membrane protein TerC